MSNVDAPHTHTHTHAHNTHNTYTHTHTHTGIHNKPAQRIHVGTCRGTALYKNCTVAPSLRPGAPSAPRDLCARVCKFACSTPCWRKAAVSSVETDSLAGISGCAWSLLGTFYVVPNSLFALLDGRVRRDLKRLENWPATDAYTTPFLGHGRFFFYIDVCRPKLHWTCPDTQMCCLTIVAFPY